METINVINDCKMPNYIVINGFSFKDVILDVLNQYPSIENKEEIARLIEHEFAVKCNLRQA
jgi:hypothetical protein